MEIDEKELLSKNFAYLLARLYRITPWDKELWRIIDELKILGLLPVDWHKLPKIVRDTNEVDPYEWYACPMSYDHSEGEDDDWVVVTVGAPDGRGGMVAGPEMIKADAIHIAKLHNDHLGIVPILRQEE